MIAPASPEPGAAASAEPALRRIAEQVRAATSDGAALDIRGGSTKDFYGGARSGAPLELRALRGIVSYEPSELVITALAGTPLAEVESALAERGQALAFEPPRFAPGGTIGGMVAAGLSGPARASAGSVRDFILGAGLLNGRGELLHFGGQVMKNVAGYDVSRVLAGSMGVLGVICEVSIKVPPIAPASTTLEFTMAQDEAIVKLNQWMGAAFPVNASAWRGGRLRVRLAGACAAVEAGAARLEAGCGGRRLDAGESASYWSGLRDHRDDFFAGAGPSALWRLSVPPTRPPLGLPGDTLVEWGGGLRWLRTDAPAQDVRACAARAGGYAALFRGARPADGFLPSPGAPLGRIHCALKKAFDPAGIFNRGRLYPWL